MPSTRSPGGSLVVRNARVVPVGIDRGHTPDHTTVPHRPVDLRLTDGVVTEMGLGLANQGEEELDVDERWVIPGLWDRHVHWDQWAATLTRIDLTRTASADDVVATLVRELPRVPDGGAAFGFGYRSALWPAPATVAQLDAISGGRPVVLISGDAHNGWLNSAALAALGLPPREGVLEEREWFDVLARLKDLEGPGPVSQEKAFVDATRRGVVGIVDMEFGGPFLVWPERIAGGEHRLRVRACTYPSHLEQAIAMGLRTGDPLEGAQGLAHMGPLKIISDGSLNTRTAFCADPYADGHNLEHPRGRVNYPPEELGGLLDRAAGAGIEVAIHAIGDAAISEAIDAIVATGAHGSIEHAQLLAYSDLPRLAKHGIVASMQPAHLLDDRDVTAVCWPDRIHRSFMIGSLLAEGVEVAFGSDAPVSPLDPWLAMAAAVFRSGDERPQWNAPEAITSSQALASSTNGHGTVAEGAPADLAFVEVDPTEELGDARLMAQMLRRMRVGLTVVAGRPTHVDL